MYTSIENGWGNGPVHSHSSWIDKLTVRSIDKEVRRGKSHNSTIHELSRIDDQRWKQIGIHRSFPADNSVVDTKPEGIENCRVRDSREEKRKDKRQIHKLQTSRKFEDYEEEKNWWL